MVFPTDTQSSREPLASNRGDHASCDLLRRTRKIRPNRRWSILFVMLLVFVGACSDDDPARDATSSSTAGSSARSGVTGPIVDGHLTLTGGVDLSGDFTVLYPLADDRLNRCD